MSSHDTRERAEYEREQAARLQDQARLVMEKAEHEAGGLRSNADNHLSEAERLDRQAQDQEHQEQAERERQAEEERKKEKMKEMAEDVAKRLL